MIRWQSLKTRVTLLTLAIFLLSIWTLMFYASRMLRENLRDVANKQEISTVSLIATAVNDDLFTRARLMENIASGINTTTLNNPAALQKFLDERFALQLMFNAGYFVVSSDGTAISEYPRSNGRVGRNFLDEPYLLSSFKDGKATISRPFIGKLMKAPSFFVAAPINDGAGKQIGTLVGVTSLGKANFLDQYIGERYGRSGGYLLIVPEHRQVITAGDKRRIMETLPAPGKDPMLDRLLDGQAATEVVVDPYGVEMLASVTRIPSAGWLVMALLPTEEVFAPARTMRQRVLLATIALTILAGGLVWWTLKLQFAPMLAALRTMRLRSSTGAPPQALPVVRQDEVGELIGGFNRLLESLAKQEAALRSAIEFERDLIASMQDGLSVIDAQGVSTSANEALCRMTGFSREELTAIHPPFPFWPPEEYEQIQNAFDRTLAGESGSYELTFMRKDGERFPVIVSASAVKDDAGNIRSFIGTVKDISQRRRAEEEFRRAALLMDAAPSLITVYDFEGRYLYANKQTLLVHGYNLEEFLSLNLRDVAAPGDRDLIPALIHDLRGKKEASFEATRLNKNGMTIPLEIAVKVVDWGGKEAILSVATDISERRQAEATRVSLEAQLRESQKMEAIGTLAGGIAHDFNNVLATILGNVELAREDARNNPNALESLNEIRKAGERARSLVHQILSFSRRQPTERKLMAIAPIVAESVHLLRTTLPPQIELNARCAPDIPPILADATQIEQVILNLVTNSMQALSGRAGRIDIRADAIELDESMVGDHPGLREMWARNPPHVLRIVIADDGPGIDAETIPRIFEPFFTTKQVDEGTGLGLAVAHGIVRTHEGAIEVVSKPDKGATFTIYLPTVQANVEIPASAPVAIKAIVTAPTKRQIHVLYLDDDEALLFLIQRSMEQRGFRISAFASQHEALAALRAAPDEFDLVVTDYNMPGMSGLDVASAVAKIRSDLPVAIASGFIDEALQQQAEKVGVRELIFKANAIEDLCDAFARLAQASVQTSPVT